MSLIFLFVTAVSATVENNVRLTGGESFGRVEVYHNGIWGTVCSNTWTDKEATVVCRMLGYRYGNATSNTFTLEDSEQIWLSDVKCYDFEFSLDDCEHSEYGIHNCTNNQNVGVRCYNNEYIKTTLLTRLSYGEKWYGQIKVHINGVWGGICNNGFNDVSARVVCRSLGFQTYFAVTMPKHGRVENIGNKYVLWLTNVNCNGDESNIGLCSYELWDQTKCTNNQRAGVYCYSAVENDVRIVGGINWGRVEIYHNDTWGTVCSKSWNDIGARVVCRMLGYRYGTATSYNLNNADSTPVWLSDVKCYGEEFALHVCEHSEYGFHNCSNNQNVGVRCYDNEYVETLFPTRLSLGPTHFEGHVEVQINGLWGGICDRDWNDINAKVVCRSLGIETYYAMAVRKSGYAADNVLFPMWLRNVKCHGNESNIGLCKYQLWNQKKCTPNQTAGVICYKTVNDYIRLRDGEAPIEGRVELYYRGQWGAFCGRWDDNHARVVCRNLGYRGGIGLKNDVWRDSIYGNGDGKFWAQWINCIGNETRITDCRNNIEEFEDRWCLNMGALSVRCLADLRNATIRLLHGPSERHGMIEITMNGIRGTICDMGYWSFYDAEVACKMLGFNDTAIAEPITDGYFVLHPKLIKNVKCWIGVDNFEDCHYQFWRPQIRDCTVWENVFVGVNCIRNVSDYIRLVNGKFAREGRVEIYHKENWGAICNLKFAFNRNAAKTVCKTLGYRGGITMDVALYGGGIDRISIGRYQCGRNSRHIGECFQKDYDQGITAFCDFDQASVRCIEEDIPKQLPIRLVSGQNDQEGIIEVHFDGLWWNVCDDDWDIHSANVVCKALGLKQYFAIPVPGVDFGTADRPVLFNKVKCKGNETGIGECRYGLFKGEWRCRSVRSRAAVKCLTGFEVNNETMCVWPKTGKQVGNSYQENDTNGILYGVSSGLVMYSIAVTIITIALTYLYLKSRLQNRKQQRIIDLSRDEGGLKDTSNEVNNDSTGNIANKETGSETESKERTEL